MADYGEFCKSKNCEHFIAWEFNGDEETQPYPCESCKLIGYSYSVVEYPENCPFKSEIEHFNDVPNVQANPPPAVGRSG